MKRNKVSPPFRQRLALFCPGRVESQVQREDAAVPDQDQYPEDHRSS